MAEVSYVELQERIAKRLQLIAETESVPSNYADDIQAACKSVQAQLAELQIGAFDVEQGVDFSYVDAFVDLASAELADEFGLPEPRRTELKSQKLGMPGRSAAERRMRTLFPSRKLVTDHDVTAV